MIKWSYQNKGEIIMEAFYISLVRKFMSLMLAFFALAGANKTVEVPPAAPLAEGADLSFISAI